jgi:hypothetical protein
VCDLQMQRDDMAEESAAVAARAQRRVAALERKIGQQRVELDFFSASLAASRGTTPAERRACRDGFYEVIQAMMASQSQAEIRIERMCQLAGICRSRLLSGLAAIGAPP